MFDTRVVILGAGEVASGVAVRLHRSGFPLLLTEVPEPRAIRRLVSFSDAVYDGVHSVEGIRAARVGSILEANETRAKGPLPILVDEQGGLWPDWRPQVLVDGRMLKGDHGLSRRSAPCVIGLGPGFSAGDDCSLVVETMRGHDLGRLLARGAARADSGIPGELAGEGPRRLLRSPGDGIFQSSSVLGSLLKAGDEVGSVDGAPVLAEIGGLLRGLIRPGGRVRRSEKVADIDPRGDAIDPRAVSDRALAIAGGVLEGILGWMRAVRRGGRAGA